MNATQTCTAQQSELKKKSDLYTCIKFTTREEVGYKTRVKSLFLSRENGSAHGADVPRAVRFRELQFGERRRDTAGEVSEVRVGRLDGILEYLSGKKNNAPQLLDASYIRRPATKICVCVLFRPKWYIHTYISNYWPRFQKWYDTIQHATLCYNAIW